VEGVLRQDQDEEAKEDACSRIDRWLITLPYLITPHDFFFNPSSTRLYALTNGVLCIDSFGFGSSRVHSSSFHATCNVISSRLRIPERPLQLSCTLHALGHGASATTHSGPKHP